MATDYVPALRFKALTRFYDPLLQLTLRERRFKQALIEQVQIPDEGTVIDVGCGTGTLTIGLKQHYPTAHVIGLDADPDSLERARRKARAAQVDVEFLEGQATELPFAAGMAQRIVSSLFLHHLQPQDKVVALTQALRVLSDDGELHIADWGTPTNLWMRALFVPVRLLDGFSNTKDHVDGELPAIIQQSGGQRVKLKDQFNTAFGTLALLEAHK